MLAYYVEHHMLEKLAPMLYRETDPVAAQALCQDVVTKAQRFPAAKQKEATHKTTSGLPVHSFQGLMAHLATYCRLIATTPLNDKYQFTLYTKPTPPSRDQPTPSLPKRCPLAIRQGARQ